ncbi:MAG: hypothetical protein QF797_09425 [Alphaproteobacteria bacterium]|mgnify:CR=1 FL=1|jgi:hypothetical protein|nr:hypothetical protein [Rhodospirillaceae bacterium]MDP6405415.1 hypothetical protein [Alphaproteobacteria bacterium]MDP6622330.1 hypothetical protein [Alphaproteobacteria bacterium]|tara:strand:- start:399 stop:1019 length:621 start_codon:yes stop_codon:yes gene_type:complete
MVQSIRSILWLLFVAVLVTPATATEKPSFENARVIKIPEGISDISIGEGSGRQKFKVAKVRSAFNGSFAPTTYRFLYREILGWREKVVWGTIPITWNPRVDPKTSVDRNFKHILPTYDGAACNVADARLLITGKGSAEKLLLIYANREFSRNIFGGEPITFSVFDFFVYKEVNHGEARYFFRFRESFKTREYYCDVNEAFEGEFGF